jgi:hypothetical protein
MVVAELSWCDNDGARLVVMPLRRTNRSYLSHSRQSVFDFAETPFSYGI